MKELAKAITRKVFGKAPGGIEQIKGKGVVNLVFKISLDNEHFILRFQKGRSALSNFEKEKWCMDAVSKKGVKTSRCVALGFYKGHAYSFQSFISGKHGGDVLDQNGVWLALGKYAKKVNSIRVEGYGEEFKFLESKAHHDWKGVNDWQEDYFFNDKFFEKYKLFPSNKLAKIKKRVLEMRKWNFKPTLSHANLTPRNTIVRADGSVHIIDWGTASGHLSPHRDVAELLTWNIKDKHLKTFLKGYGISERQFEKIKYDSETIMISRLLSALRWGIENKKNWREVDFIKHCIKKLNSIRL